MGIQLYEDMIHVNDDECMPQVFSSWKMLRIEQEFVSTRLPDCKAGSIQECMPSAVSQSVCLDGIDHFFAAEALPHSAWMNLFKFQVLIEFVGGITNLSLYFS